jgi:hypothetical protein
MTKSEQAPCPVCAYLGQLCPLCLSDPEAAHEVAVQEEGQRVEVVDFDLVSEP